ALIAYPRTENDVRKTCRFSWQLAERGRIIPITARGAGTDQTGAALGSGIMLVFPAHMNRVLELDTKNNTVTIEPGINYAKLQQTLHTHGRFLPPYPASQEYSTVGGAIANNASGEKSVKYGDTAAFVKGLRVVLANGEVIETGRLSKRDANKKLGLATFEGEIYRSIDTLLEENHGLIEQLQRGVTRNNAGYNLQDIKRKDGSFDLTPLIAGSQGTLGIITEAVLGTEAHNPQTTVALAKFDSLEYVQNAVMALKDLPEPPSAIELINEHALREVHELNPNQLKDIIAPPFPAVCLVVEFDGGDRAVKKVAKKVSKIFEEYAIEFEISDDPEQQQRFWQLRQSISALIGHNQGLQRAVPLIDDAAVPVDRLREYIEGSYKILNTNNLPPAVWGHAGDGNLHMQPHLNVGQVGDRQKAFRLLDEYYKLVLKLGGTVSSEAGDGRLKTPYLEAMYGGELYGLFQKVKSVFDPYGTLNPGVKFGTSIDDLKGMVRPEYSFDHLYDHLPRS
ncbi:MAG TPA: FAD-binding oxidoreductase, partial [Candidatus Saccharimonadales bacterium]|nr:FAD-binding oxidoreductase [Candidatus Saccharimonadales bacterium]